MRDEMRRKAGTPAPFDPTSLDEAGRTAWFCLNKYAVDRDGEVLVPEGCDTAAYLANPVVMLFHNGAQFPAGQAKQVEIRPGDGVYLQVEFTALDLPDDNEQKQLVEAVWAMVKAGTLRAVSAGFRPLEVSREKLLPGQRGASILRWELLECSLVTVPANPHALIKAVAEGAEESAARLLWPDEVARLRADREGYPEARFRGALVRAARGLHDAACYLRHVGKGLPPAVNKAYALQLMLRDADVAGDANRPSVLGEIMALGRLTGLTFVPDHQAEWTLEEDVDGDADWNGRVMPGARCATCGEPAEPGRCEVCEAEAACCRTCGCCAEHCGCAGEEPAERTLSFPARSHAPAPTRTPAAEEAGGGVPSAAQGLSADRLTEAVKQVGSMVGAAVSQAVREALPAAIDQAAQREIGGRRG